MRLVMADLDFAISASARARLLVIGYCFHCTTGSMFFLLYMFNVGVNILWLWLLDQRV